MNVQARIHLDPARVIGTRDALMFGHFIEHFHRQVYGGIFEPGSPLADSRGFREDVIAALRHIRPATIRWPGGCFVSAYHWLDGVGPRRQSSFDKAWRVEEPNTFGTDELIAFCRAVGAEPYLCTNAGTAPPEEGSNWLEYCNLRSEGRWAQLRIANGISEPHYVRYWSVGNENYGDWEMGAKDADEWSSYVREAAKMMRRVDSSIRLSAASTSDLDWNVKLLRAAGPYLDLISLHYYPAGDDTSYETCMARAHGIEEHIARTEHILGALGMDDHIRIAIDEWNPRGWYHPSFRDPDPRVHERDRNDDNATYTMADAIMHACFLNACLRHCRSVEITNLSPVVNTRGAIYTYPEGIVLRSTYHVCDLYANHTYAQVLDALCVSPRFTARDANGSAVEVPYCDLTVTMDPQSNRLAVAIANLHPQDHVACTMWLPGGMMGEHATLRTVTGATITSYNDRDHPNDVTITTTAVSASRDTCVVTVPPHSVNVLTLEQNH